jgi:hypothetical protein
MRSYKALSVEFKHDARALAVSFISTAVMAGLVSAIPRRMRSIRPHAAPLRKTFRVSDRVTAWMAGTSPAMTMRVVKALLC